MSCLSPGGGRGHSSSRCRKLPSVGEQGDFGCQHLTASWEQPPSLSSDRARAARAALAMEAEAARGAGPGPGRLARRGTRLALAVFVGGTLALGTTLFLGERGFPGAGGAALAPLASRAEEAFSPGGDTRPGLRSAQPGPEVGVTWLRAAARAKGVFLHPQADTCVHFVRKETMRELLPLIPVSVCLNESSGLTHKIQMSFYTCAFSGIQFLSMPVTLVGYNFKSASPFDLKINMKENRSFL